MSNSLTVQEPQILIGGVWSAGSAGVTDIINPATEQVVGQAPEATVADALAAARAAREALPSWARTSPEERAILLDAVSERLRERMDSLVPLIISETGATVAVGSALQVPLAIDRFAEAATAATRSLAQPLPPVPMPSTPLAPGALMGAVANAQPVGVVVCIVPYNFPLASMAGKVAAALAMGNTVIMRPPPQDPLAIIELARIMVEVGFPPGVINLITSASPEPAAALVESPDVDMVSFTGSVPVGCSIAQNAGRRVKRTLLELGGKGAAIVLADADVDRAVTTLGSCWNFHSGQVCQAPSRAVVHRSRADELVSKLTAAGKKLTVGDPLDPATIVGPLISETQRSRVEGYVDGARRAGAEVALGGERPELDHGFYVGPTLLTGCTPDMQIAQEEVFGPVIAVLEFDSEEEAIEIANGTEYGLYDYIFSTDSARAYQLARELRSGGVGINTNQRHMQAPFGGTKLSGLGREGGVYSYLEYIEWQTVSWPA